jgi:putative heme-binding domain-containing protein
MVTTAADPATHPFAAYEAPRADTPRLFAELAEPAWSRRKEAHVELLRRVDLDEADLLARCDRAEAGAVEHDHLLWLVALRAAPDAARDRLVTALRSRSATTRLQAVRAHAERFPDQADDLLPLLDDPDPHVVRAVVAACFDDATLLDDDSAVSRVVAGPARSVDSHVRQAAARLLADRLDAARLRSLATADAADVRLAGVLAAGFRLTLPQATTPLDERVPLAAWRNPDASCRLTFVDGTVDLRDLGRIGTFTMAERWRAGGHTGDEEALFGILAGRLGDADERVRLQAVHFLSVLADPRSEQTVAAARADAARSREASGTSSIRDPTPVAPGSELPPDRPAFDAAKFAGRDWTAEAAKGDARRGRLLFGAAGVGCASCHAVAADESVAGGPSLASAAKRFAVGYLAESVLEPGRVVAPLFRASTVVTTDGRSVTGLVVGETAERLDLVVADGSRVAVPVAEIDERVVQDVSPMPSGLVRTPEELRDILAYLCAPDDGRDPAPGTP